MKIAFDAKRAFHNHRGLGNYSRDTIRILHHFYPEEQLFLMNPKAKNSIPFIQNDDSVTSISPDSFGAKLFPALWRSRGMNVTLAKIQPDIYHGLSQELPLGIHKTGIRTVVTMHDTIFMRYPELYSTTYRAVFIKKNRYACKTADKIIAISEQTKQDVMTYFGANEQKIEVVYQGCNNIFRNKATLEEKNDIRVKYNLPSNYMLFVGAIEPRKNISSILRSMSEHQIDLPLVVVGHQTKYAETIVNLAERFQVKNRLLLLHNVSTNDLPAMYQMAKLFVYPSVFEGFGIPILEALCSGTPVITSRGSCFEETGGPFSKYINPTDYEELGNQIKTLLDDAAERQLMIKEGYKYAENFTDEKIAQSLHNVYSRFI